MPKELQPRRVDDDFLTGRRAIRGEKRKTIRDSRLFSSFLLFIFIYIFPMKCHLLFSCSRRSSFFQKENTLVSRRVTQTMSCLTSAPASDISYNATAFRFFLQ